MTPITWYLYGRSGGAKKAAEEIGVKESVSGDIAVISDGADDVAVKSLVAEITPVQSGSGDPSPTNIRPISGRTGLTVARAGKNIMPVCPVGRSENPSITTDGDVYTINGTATGYIQSVANEAFTLLAGDYYFKTFTISGTGDAVIQLRSTDGRTTYATINKSGGATFNLAEDTEVKFRITANAGDFSNLKIQCMVSKGTTAPTTYAPYSGATYYPITWQTEAGTVYGGTLDVVSGVLTVDRGINVIDGTQAIVDNGTQAYGGIQVRYIPTPAKAFAPSTAMQNYGLMSDKFETTQAYSDSEYQATGRSTNEYVYFNMPASVTTAAQAREWFTNNPTQIVYPLATPQTYNITPTEIKTLLGGNTIYTDAGAVSVEYVADTKLYIDNKVAELQALILEN